MAFKTACLALPSDKSYMDRIRQLVDSGSLIYREDVTVVYRESGWAVCVIDRSSRTAISWKLIDQQKWIYAEKDIAVLVSTLRKLFEQSRVFQTAYAKWSVNSANSTQFQPNYRPACNPSCSQSSLIEWNINPGLFQNSNLLSVSQWQRWCLDWWLDPYFCYLQ